MRKLTYWLVGLVLIGVAIGAVLLLNNIQEITWKAAENATCEATVADAGGADINSAFRFSFADDVSANAVRRFLTVEPAIELNFHQGLQAREVLAVPLEPLQPGTVYRFSLATERETLYWAFQTKSEWRVESANPAYAATSVSVQSALELYLNQSLNADLASLNDYMQISPATAGKWEQTGNCLRFTPDAPWASATVYTVRLAAGLPALGSDITLAEDFSVAFETAGNGVVTEQLWRVEGMNQLFLPGQALSFSCELPQLPPAPQPLPEETTEPPQQEEPKITASLYRYADAETYAAELLARQNSAPWWSMNARYAQGAPTEGLTWLSNQELAPHATNNGFSTFSWPYVLPSGCYLLKVSYLGQSRDLRFQVSELTAFVQATEGQSLVWAHDADSGMPLSEYSFTYINDGQEILADANGLAILNLQRSLVPLEEPGFAGMRQDIFLLRQGKHSLVLMDYAPMSMADNINIWQYLRLSAQSYKSGDTLDFWGYMRQHDNSDWEWSRVSVYIAPVNAPGEPVAQGYAPLSGNTFYGSVELPRLLPGVYELQIWQSGQQLLSQAFLVDTTDMGSSEVLNNGAEAADAAMVLSSDKPAYTINEGYTLSLSGAGESDSGYLFFKNSQGLQEAVLETEAYHQGVFDIAEAGNTYWQAVSYTDGQYQVSQPLNLAVDNSAYALNVQLEKREKANRTEEQTVVGITVRDATGAAPDKASLLALAAPPGVNTGDILAELYAPYYAGSTSAAANLLQIPDSAENIMLFNCLELDKNGQAELTLSLPAGEWRLYVWVVADATLPLAGQAALMLATTANDSAAQNTPDTALSGHTVTPFYWATRYDMSEGSSHFIREGLLYFSSANRVQAMELLWQPLFGDNYTVEQRLGRAYTSLLWQRHGYEGLPLPLTPAEDLKDFQLPDGGITAQEDIPADLVLSMLTAALINDGLDAFDSAALARYLEKQAASAVTAERRALAMAGLAALNKPVLQELKLMLAQAEQTPYSRAALIWGLAQAGDIQVAKAYLYDFWATYASDATSGNTYLEGGEGENTRLNRMGALAAAACGEAQTSFAMLQYLRTQQEYDYLTAALVSGGLLPLLYAEPATASLTYFLSPVAGEISATNGLDYNIEIAAYEDVWREYSLPGNLLVDTVDGDIALTCLRTQH